MMSGESPFAQPSERTESAQCRRAAHKTGASSVLLAILLVGGVGWGGMGWDGVVWGGVLTYERTYAVTVSQ